MFPWERKKILTPRMKQVLRLKNLNYSHAEIGEMLGVKTETIDQLSHKAKRRVKFQKCDV